MGCTSSHSVAPDDQPPSTKVHDDQHQAPNIDSRGTWTVEKWLTGCEVDGAIAKALFPAPADKLDAVQCLADLRALGVQGDADAARAALRERLVAGNALELLVDCVLPAVLQLAAGEAASAKELHSKFVAEGSGFTLTYGGLSTFYSGLEGKVGPPEAHAECGA